jgi:hypothetical protein
LAQRKLAFAALACDAGVIGATYQPPYRRSMGYWALCTKRPNVATTYKTLLRLKSNLSVTGSTTPYVNGVDAMPGQENTFRPRATKASAIGNRAVGDLFIYALIAFGIWAMWSLSNAGLFV